MNRFVVGCPVRNRAWVLPYWFDHIERAFAAIDVKPIYAFAIGTSEDDTLGVILDRHPHASIVYTNEAPVPQSSSRWTNARFGELVDARNALLESVRLLDPYFFLSIDSDILLAEQTLPNLLETYRDHNWSAVGGKLYMTPSGMHTPSYAFNKAAGGLAREDSEGVFQVEILMALKLMDPEALRVDYTYSEKGEDVGWSLACKNAGLKLGWDGRTANKHIMLNRQLYETDPRVGF